MRDHAFSACVRFKRGVDLYSRWRSKPATESRALDRRRRIGEADDAKLDQKTAVYPA